MVSRHVADSTLPLLTFLRILRCPLETVPWAAASCYLPYQNIGHVRPIIETQDSCLSTCLLRGLSHFFQEWLTAKLSCVYLDTAALGQACVSPWPRTTPELLT
jgi:hypothetical protein